MSGFRQLPLLTHLPGELGGRIGHLATGLEHLLRRIGQHFGERRHLVRFPLDLGDRRGDPFQHVVERGLHEPQLVRAFRRRADRQIPPLRLCHDLPSRADSRDEPRRQLNEDQPHHEEDARLGEGRSRQREQGSIGEPHAVQTDRQHVPERRDRHEHFAHSSTVGEGVREHREQEGHDEAASSEEHHQGGDQRDVHQREAVNLPAAIPAAAHHGAQEQVERDGAPEDQGDRDERRGEQREQPSQQQQRTGAGDDIPPPTEAAGEGVHVLEPLFGGLL